VFFVAMLSATLLPLGSEPAVFGLVKLNPELFWPAVLVATAGNTAGGAISWWMGYGAERTYERLSPPPAARGPRAALAAALRAQGLPAELAAAGGRPAVRGGRLAAPAFWPCVLYMAIGKFARYVTMTAALLWVFPGRLPM
jgi:membrane protein YqaA with SNARE-associated domain